MQTFLPHPSFVHSAAVLDWRRLGKQRVECAQLLASILTLTPRAGWSRHPARLMWTDHPEALGLYYSVVCHEWTRRGYTNNMWTPYDTRLRPQAPVAKSNWSAFLTDHTWPPAETVRLPPWLGDPALHASHRGNLLRKDPDWYGVYGWTESPEMEYVWPSRSAA